MRAADFETLVNLEKTRVWAWCVVRCEDEETEYGNSIESFIEYTQNNTDTYYFHNLKFDGSFILDYLFRAGYVWSGAKKLKEKEFSTLISDAGLWYQISIRFPDSNGGMERKITIYDSLKLIPMPIADMPKTFCLDIEKLELDYDGDREEGHELTEEEQLYIRNDTLILARSLVFMKDNGMKKLTTASNAMNDFKIRTGKDKYKKMFPELTSIEDFDIRKSYKGGFTYLNPKYRGAKVGKGLVYDVNSMYPWAMRNCLLPYGKPYYFSGKYIQNECYPLYVQCLTCEFKLKPGHIPSIQIKNNFRYSETEYLTHSEDETILYLTSVDLKLFFDNYDVKVYEWNGGYMFMGRTDIFVDYIDYWYNEKDENKKIGNSGRVKIAKLMLNGLYGKFGGNPKGRSKIPFYDDEQEKVRFKLGPVEDRTKFYVPIAAFITSYARDKIIRSAEKCGDSFIYADTDSLHVLGTDTPDIEIDEHRLGAFKIEEEFDRAIFLRQKTYLEIFDEKMDVKCAGMPKNVKKKVTEENFKYDAEFTGKLMPKVISGGVVLKETTFKIKR